MDQPYIESIRKLVTEMAAGRIQVPRFQRPFVWDDEQRLELLQSIRDGIPIGSILLWKTDKHDLACFDHVGPHPMAPPPTVPGNLRQYLLDGHQRLSTLFGTMHALPPGWEPKDDAPDWRIVYDLKSQEFHFPRRQRYRPEWMPVHCLHDRGAYLRYLRGLANALPADAATAAENEAEAIATRFDEYRVPVILLSTDNLDDATRTFQRVNSLGTPMDEANMVIALTWSTSFDLRLAVEGAREALPPRWRDIDDRSVLNVCKGLRGMEINKAAEQRLAKELRSSPALIEEAGRYLADAATLLEAIGVPGSLLVPYRMQWVVTAVALAFETSRDTSAFDAWFQVSTYTAAFAAASSSQVLRQLSACRAALQGHRPHIAAGDELAPFPARFDFRVARAKLFLINFAWDHGARLPDGSRYDPLAVLGERGPSVLQYIFLPGQVTPAWLGSAANRLILPAEQATSARKCIHEAADVDFLESHWIDPDLARALAHGGPAARVALLERRQSRFEELEVRQIRGLTKETERP